MIYARNILEGRRYLVLGATGGAGRATALLLSQCGASVTCMGRDPERTERVKRELHGGGHDTVITDFGKTPEPVLVGKYDGIFHAAGQEMISLTAMLRPDAVAYMFDTSIGAALWLSSLVGKRDSLLKDGGSFVMMSSVAAVCGTPGMTAYAASKGAIESMVRSAAVEWAPRRIRVNAIRAGAFSGPMHSRIVERGNERSLAEYEAKHPLGFGKADDIAQMVVFLMSDGSKWQTGSIIALDGGYSAK